MVNESMEPLLTCSLLPYKDISINLGKGIRRHELYIYVVMSTAGYHNILKRTLGIFSYAAILWSTYVTVVGASWPTCTTILFHFRFR